VTAARPAAELPSIADELESFIRESFQVPPNDPTFSRSLNLWDEGYVDSPGVLEVLAYLEDRYGVTIPQEALFLPEFTCINGMAQVVAELAHGVE
jgi:acyl carrier protein